MPPRVCAAECANGREESAVDSTARQRQSGPMSNYLYSGSGTSVGRAEG